MAYNNNNNKKIVVFGATGSVGTDLIEIVSNNEPNWKIVAVSRSGPNTNARLASLHLPNVDIVKGDVEDLESAKQITNDADMVFSCVGFVQYEQPFSNTTRVLLPVFPRYWPDRATSSKQKRLHVLQHDLLQTLVGNHRRHSKDCQKGIHDNVPCQHFSSTK